MTDRDAEARLLIVRVAAIVLFGLAAGACGADNQGPAAPPEVGATGGTPSTAPPSAGSGGNGQAGADQNPTPPTATAPDISGLWATFVFEDPVQIAITQHGGDLSGRGCCVWPDGFNSVPIDCCGPVTGTIAGREADFGFPAELEGAPEEIYAAQVTVSADASRMAGQFEGVGDGTTLTAWVRLPDEQGWLRNEDATLAEAVALRNAHYELLLIDSVTGGDELAPNVPYGLTLFNRLASLPFVLGDLGHFWAGEMSWNEVDQTLVVGPVSATRPELATGLVLTFAGTELATVEATFPSGHTYTLSPSP